MMCDLNTLWSNRTLYSRVQCLFVALCFLALVFVPQVVFAQASFLTDTLSDFSTDSSRVDTCGSCHASWTGSASARGDFALNYKLWDYDTVTTGMSPALRKIDMFNVGTSNDWRVANQASDAPFPFTGAADKDGDGYINFIYRTERAGLPINPADICSTCVGSGADLGLPTPPAGWDLDDNNAAKGNVPWSWTTVLAQAGANAQEKLSGYFSDDVAAPNPIADLRLDIAWVDANSAGVMPTNALPITWTAPSDDDPLAPGAIETTVPVHHYDLRYTTEQVLSNYNSNFPGVRCSSTAGVPGSLQCLIRNPDHWYTLSNISDCGISTGSGQDNLTPSGVVLAAGSNACASGLAGWNRGEATPLMRGLYESDFEDEVSGQSAPAYTTGAPFAPATPGSTETYVLQEVTSKHAYSTSGLFQATDIHDSATNKEPNYIAPDTVYWMTMLSDDGTVLPCVESTGDERTSSVGPVATNFCQPDAGDATIWGGPFTEADGLGKGFHSYAEPGFQPYGNIIAIKTGGGVRSGIGITGISPTALDSFTSPAVVTIDGIGFSANVDPAEVTAGAKVVLTSTVNDSVIESDGVVTLDGTTPDRKMTVSFPIAALAGDYNVEIRDQSGLTVAAWMNAVNITSSDPGTIRLVPPGTFSVSEDAGPGNIAVERIGGTAGAVSVQVDTADGTATLADNDYTAVTGVIVSWADGVSGQQNVPVAITADGAVEPDETINVTLSNATGTTLDNLQATESGTLTILNDDVDPGTVEFSVTNYSVVENIATATITVNRIGGIDGPISVDFSTSDGTAVTTEPDNTNGLRDYEPNSGTLSWIDQESGAKTFDITINSDTSQEADETVILTLANPTGGATISGTNPATLTIVDDDTPATLQFDTSTYTVDENAGTATLNVVRTGSLLDAVSVSFFTTDNGAVTTGTTVAGTRDYEPVLTGAQTLSWGAGIGGIQTLTITLNEDALDELDTEDFSVTLDPGSITGNAAVGAINTTAVSLTDNDSVLEFAAPTYSVDETGVSVTISVTRTDLSNTFPGAVSVQYATSDGTAVSNGTVGAGTLDFDAIVIGPTLNWGAGISTTQTFTVTINDDTIVESLETFSIALANAAGDAAGQATVGAQATTSVDIVDDEQPGTLQFDNASYSGNEDGGTDVTITVTRTGGSAGAAAVNYATSDGTATLVGNDYVAASGTLNWADGVVGAQTFTVTINDDAIDEDPDETVNLTLSGFTGASAGAQTTATLTIVDSVGSIQFDNASYSVNEDGAGVVSIAVSRTGGSNGPASVSYATSNGTATTVDGDYVAASGTLNWVDGVSGAQTFTVTINNDAIAEDPDETVNLTLSGFTGASAGVQTTATLTIVDSFGSVQFDSATYSVDEDGGVAATITVMRVGGTNGAISVDYAAADNTAVAPGDYTATSGTLNWADGDATSKTFSVSVVNDAVAEDPDEILDLNLSNPLGGAQLGTQTTAALTIIDSVGTIQFDSATYSVNEDGGVDATITVARVGGSNGAASVGYVSADGALNPATAGVDYTAVSGTLNWVDGDAASKTFTIPVVNDADIEVPNETVDLTLSGFVGAAEGVQSTATLTIVDGAGAVQLTASSYSINEDGLNLDISVQRVGGITGAVSVNYATIDGSALAGSDYSATSGTLNWADGDGAAKVISIPILDDFVVDGDETFSLALSNPVGIAVGTPAAATVTILENDIAGNLEFTTAGFSVNESAGVATITVRRSLGSVGAIDVTYATSDATAVAGSDYVATSGVLSWPDGDTLDKSFDVIINPDVITEAGGEILNLTLSNPTNSATLDQGPGVQQTATLHIIDSIGTLQFTSSGFNANEQTGSAIINVERVGGSGGAVSVDYASVAGALNPATAGVDYTNVTGTLNWADGEVITKTFTVPLVDDDLIESDETVDLTLSNPGGGAVLGSPSTAVLTVISEDGPGTIQFYSSGFGGFENAGVVTVTVSRIGGKIGDVAVYYQTQPDTVGSNPATANDDYIAIAPTRIDWLDGDDSDKTFDVVIPDDANYEPDETFLVELLNPVGTILSTPTTAEVSIGNDDASMPTSITIDPGWSMISVPSDLLAQNLAIALFGDDWVGPSAKTSPRPTLYRRISDGTPGAFSGIYAVTDTIAPGAGYFIENDLSVPVTLDDQYNAVQTIDPFEITMQVGGNMLGNPYQSAIDILVDARVCNDTLTLGCTQPTDWVSWDVAATNGWVTGSIYRYNTAADSYDIKNPADGTMIMNPWEAYWFRTETADSLKLRLYDQVVAP